MRAVLTYHSIDASGSPISVHPDAFDRHLAWLTSGRVVVTTPEQLMNLPDSADAVAVTFDDAFENFAMVASRLLTARVPVTVFVVSDRVGRTNAWEDRPQRGIPVLPLLDWSALAKLQDQGVVLGAHSRTHRDLTRLTRSELDDEVRGSADAIVKATGACPTSFAYPYGRVNDVAAHVVGATFACGCTTEFRPVDDGVDRARVPRLDMYYMQRLGRIERFGTPGFKRFINVRHRLRRAQQAVAAVRHAQIGMLS